MKILAFESSCDETAAAVVEDGRRIRRGFCTYEAAQEWIAKMCECGGEE